MPPLSYARRAAKLRRRTLQLRVVVRDGAVAAAYRPRHPEQLLLRRLVTEHLDEFLAEARAQHDKPLPAYVEKELRAFIQCGIAQFGFAVFACPSCPERKLVAFRCGGRGFCPSCTGRKMAQGAVNLVDHVLPRDVALRQLVLTFPFDLRARFAYD